MKTRIAVIGLGLAGATFTHMALERGMEVVAFDAGEPLAAWQASNGHLNLITGPRLNLIDEWRDVLQFSIPFWRSSGFGSSVASYRWVRETNLPRALEHIHTKRARWVQSDEEIPEISRLSISPRARWLKLFDSIRVDVCSFIQTVRGLLGTRNLYSMSLTAQQVSTLTATNSLMLPNRDVSVDFVVDCRGAWVDATQWTIKMRNAFGESLRAWDVSPNIMCSLNGKSTEWDNSKCIGLGSTYAWDFDPTSDIPDTVSQLHSYAKAYQLNISDLSARHGIRPVVEGRKPIILQHTNFPDSFCINGLGSKGAAYAPIYASRCLEKISVK